MEIKKGDFIEIDFTGRIKDGNIFDTTIKSVAEEEKLDSKNVKPFILSVGSDMLPKGFDDDLIGKDIEKKYSVNVSPEKGFGLRNKSLVKMVPTKLFYEQKIMPQRGMQLALDDQVVKIISVSGGRTLVDFNGPLAGREIIYDYKINRLINDEKEKINSLQDFFFRKKFDFEIKDNKILFNIDKEYEPYFKIFAGKFKEILGKDIEISVKNI